MTDHLRYRRLVLSALVGALLGLLFDFVVTSLTGAQSPFSLGQLPSYVGFGVVGFAGGWLFELFKAQTEVTQESAKVLDEMRASVEQLTRRITYQDRALEMLTDSPRHNEALGALLKASLADNFRSIPMVGVPAYLRLLSLAINHADTYEGTHRNTFRWYADRKAGHYLEALRNKKMAVKRRFVVIDDADLDALLEDLADPEVMDYYWQHTGDVETFWMTAGEFRHAFPGRDVPVDLALYDRQLWVAYDEDTKTLTFDVLPPEADVCRLLDDLHEMIGRQAPELKRVERP